MSNNTSNMVTFEEKVISFQKENENVNNELVRGSDNHLDFLLKIRQILAGINAKYEAFLADIIPASNKLSVEEIQKVLPGLLDLYSSSIQLVATLKRKSLNHDLKSTYQPYFAHVEGLREYIYDLENFRGDDFLDKTLQEINEI